MTDKKRVAQIFNNYFSLIQNVGEEHDSGPNVVVDISVHTSIAAIRDECVVAAQFEFNHVSMAEIELIISLYPNKAIGHDQIPARVLRDGASVLAAPIARLIKGAVSRQSSSFSLILPISRPQSLWNLK